MVDLPRVFEKGKSTGRCVRSSVGPGFDSVESFFFSSSFFFLFPPLFFFLLFFKTKPHTK